MLSGPTRKRLIEDIDFRNQMKEAAGSEVALPGWVLQQLVKSNHFLSLIEEALSKFPQDSREDLALRIRLRSDIEGKLTAALDELDSEGKRRFFASLGAEGRPLRFLIGEIIQRYNNRFTVLSGLKMLLKYLPESKDSGTSDDQHPLWGPETSQRNPLINLLVAAFLGVGSITTGALGVKYWKSLDLKVTVTPDADAWEKTAQKFGKLSPEVHLKMPDEIKLSAGECSVCKEPGPLKGNFTLDLKDKLPEFKFNGTLVLPESPKDGKSDNAFNVNLRIPELSSFKPFPPTLKVDSVPYYRVDNLPSSYTVLAPHGTAEMNVWFPSFYDTATSCAVELTLTSDDNGKPIVSGEVKQPCQPSTPKQLTKQKFQLPLSGTSGWHFVPEIGASVKIEELHSGVIGFRKSTFRISIQAVPYPNLQIAGSPNPTPTPTPSTGSQPAATPAKSGTLSETKASE